MNETIYKDAREFLDPIYKNVQLRDERPFITLTFAQSLDGKIAKRDQQILISGKESMAMTHKLRTFHDGILVGIGTALVDDPQLNARYLSASETFVNQPQPIVLDPSLRLSANCKLVNNHLKGIGRQLWLIASERGCSNNAEKKLVLENASVKIIPIKEEQNGRIPLTKVYEALKNQGIDTLMIEGGSKIIQSCIQGEWDQLIITTGPLFIGSDGISAITDATDMPQLKDIRYQVMGRDNVMAATN